jgi:hypothetical protein
MTLIEKLISVPVGRWSTIKTEKGSADVYRGDAEDTKSYIIEAPGHPRVRLQMKKALNVLREIVGDIIE